jgi:hypothetical protein
VSSNLAITSVQWQRNVGGTITTITSSTNTNKYSGSTTTTPSLTIFSAQQSDVGTYTCFASNSVGTGQSTTTTLSVTLTGSMYFEVVHKILFYITIICVVRLCRKFIVRFRTTHSTRSGKSMFIVTIGDLSDIS